MDTTLTRQQRQAFLSGLHVFVRQDLGVVFDPDTLAFFKVDAQTGHLLQDLRNGSPAEEVTAKYHRPAAEVEQFLAALQSETRRQAELRPAKVYDTGLLGERLIVLVSQTCNMRCRYCNAGGGNYGQESGLMTPETARQALETFIQDGRFLFQGVQFFGGEPTLNVPAVRTICEHLHQAHRQRRIAALPWFTLITNGLVMNDEFVQLVRDYAIKVTVSVDGPQALHDRHRLDRAGQGTYQRVIDNVARLRAATDGQQPEAIEATVTRHHLDAGMTHAGLQAFFAQELDIHRTHLALIEGGYDMAGRVSEAERTQWLIDAQASVIDDLQRGEPQASTLGLRLLKKLIFKRISPYICPVGIAALTVNVNGAIYPCYQLMDNPFSMGHVAQTQPWQTPAYQEVVQKLRANDKFHNVHCRDCWARGVCSGCLGELYAGTGSIEGRIEANCNGIRGGVEEVLYGLVKLRSDADRWAAMLAKLNSEFKRADSAAEVY
ncbi:MAG: radical SAM protein [Chloroflexota bacterium]